MKILLIGGTGLISSSIVPLLLDRGDDVTIFSRGQSARAIPARCAQVTGDRTTDELGRAFVGDATYDCVIDMICFHPGELESAAALMSGRVGQYILTSTVDVYRKPASRYPYLEDEDYGGIGSYAQEKVLCERAAWERHDDVAFPVTIVRPAATYGDGHPPVHTLGRGTSYLDRLRRGKPIVVHGDGSSFWVSCHADDVAAGIVGAVGNDRSFGRSYHLAGEEWVTWDQHHAAVANAIGAPPPTFVHIPTDALVALAGQRAELARDNFQFNNIFDNSAARMDLGFRYTTTLREGLPGWFASLERAGLIADSDLDPFEDRLIAAWGERLIADGLWEGNS